VYFWRARATNGTITTAFSAVESFKAGGGLCSIGLTPTSVSVAAGGGSSTITITTSSACNWSAISNDGFIVLTSPSSGSGNGSLTFSVVANTVKNQTATISISGQTITVSQAAAGAAPAGLSVSFQLFDPAAQGGPTTECRFRDQSGTNPTTCTLQSTSFATGTNTIVSQTWNVQYTYVTVKTFLGTNPTLSFTDTCGQMTSTDDGVAQPLTVTLTVVDSNGVTATATSGVGAQPALFVRLFTCGM